MFGTEEPRADDKLPCDDSSWLQGVRGCCRQHISLACLTYLVDHVPCSSTNFDYIAQFKGWPIRP